MMLLRVSLLGPVILLSLVAVLALEQSHQMLIAGLILVLMMPFDGVSVFALVFQLRVNNLVPMLVLTLKSVLWAIAVVIVNNRGGGMEELAIALAITNAIGAIAQTALALRLLGRWPRPSRKLLRPLVSIGIPLGIAGVLVIAYARIDQVLVYAIAGSREAGLYGAAYNMLEASHFIPISILTTLTPIIAASWPKDRERMLALVRRAAELLSVASLGALAFTAVAATPVVELIFGASFTEAGPALPVLTAAFVFICFGYLQGTLLTVMGQQRRLLGISIIALVVNLAGNFALIPAIGFIGAAWMTLITEVVVCGLSLRLILRKLDMPLPQPGRVGRVFFAAVLLGVGLELLSVAGASLGVLAAAALVGYPTLLLGLRALTVEDMLIALRREPV